MTNAQTEFGLYLPRLWFVSIFLFVFKLVYYFSFDYLKLHTYALNYRNIVGIVVEIFLKTLTMALYHTYVNCISSLSESFE